MTKCCIRGCSSDCRKNNEGLSFFRFPKNENLKRLWNDSIGAGNLKPVSVLRICSKHFEENCINRTLEVARLKDNVVPTIFPLNKPTGKPRAALEIRTKNMTALLEPNTSKNCLAINEELLSAKPFTASNTPLCNNLIMVIDAIDPTHTQQSQIPSIDVHLPLNSKKMSLVLPIKTTTKMQRLYMKFKLQQKKIKILSQKCRRLKQKVINYQNVIDELKKKQNFVS